MRSASSVSSLDWVRATVRTVNCFRSYAFRQPTFATRCSPIAESGALCSSSSSSSSSSCWSFSFFFCFFVFFFAFLVGSKTYAGMCPSLQPLDGLPHIPATAPALIVVDNVRFIMDREGILCSSYVECACALRWTHEDAETTGRLSVPSPTTGLLLIHSLTLWPRFWFWKNNQAELFWLSHNFSRSHLGGSGSTERSYRKATRGVRQNTSRLFLKFWASLAFSFTVGFSLFLFGWFFYNAQEMSVFCLHWHMIRKEWDGMKIFQVFKVKNVLFEEFASSNSFRFFAKL